MPDYGDAEAPVELPVDSIPRSLSAPRLELPSIDASAPRPMQRRASSGRMATAWRRSAWLSDAIRSALPSVLLADSTAAARTREGFARSATTAPRNTDRSSPSTSEALCRGGHRCTARTTPSLARLVCMTRTASEARREEVQSACDRGPVTTRASTGSTTACGAHLRSSPELTRQGARAAALIAISQGHPRRRRAGVGSPAGLAARHHRRRADRLCRLRHHAVGDPALREQARLLHDGRLHGAAMVLSGRGRVGVAREHAQHLARDRDGRLPELADVVRGVSRLAAGPVQRRLCGLRGHRRCALAS